MRPMSSPNCLVFCLMCSAREGSKTSAFRETNAGPRRANAGEWSDRKNTLEDPEDAAVSQTLV